MPFALNWKHCLPPTVISGGAGTLWFDFDGCKSSGRKWIYSLPEAAPDLRYSGDFSDSKRSTVPNTAPAVRSLLYLRKTVCHLWIMVRAFLRMNWTGWQSVDLPELQDETEGKAPAWGCILSVSYAKCWISVWRLLLRNIALHVLFFASLPESYKNVR